MTANWQPSRFPPPDPACVARTLGETLAALAENRPSHTAVVDRGKPIAFRGLAQRAGGLARLISATGAPPGPVALHLSTGIDAIAAWFACAIAGRPFLLLEPDHPPGRNRDLMIRAGASVLLHDEALPPSGIDGMSSLSLLQPAGWECPLQPETGLGVEEPSMIFPTSGSTGEPKLVTYSADTLQRKVQASIILMGAKPGDRVVIAGSHGNYGFIHHALVFLFSGGSVCLVDVKADGLSGILDSIRNHGASHVRFTPSLFRAAASLPAARDALWKLRAVRFSGEPLLSADLALARRLLHPDCKIQNVYGSTESSLFIWNDDRISDIGTDTAPVGFIYPSSEFRIAGEDGRNVMDGEAGELIVSSPHHALGDWRQGKVDTGRFPEDPGGGGRRLYHTGDIARCLPDGSLILVGRKDRLIKVNGQRVSLDEVEARLLAMPNCAHATVIEKTAAHGNRLVAFLAPSDVNGEKPDPRLWLAGRLPSHMIPARCEWLERMPLLPGGKVDRHRLLAAIIPRKESHSAQHQPGDFADLASIWMTVLDTSDTCPDADFPSLGGDSLQFFRLRHQLEQRFQKTVLPERFQTQPTLRGLALLLDIAIPEEPDALSPPDEPPVLFRLVRKAEGRCAGTALCMPGINGKTYSDLFITAGIFRSFDLWDCTIRRLDGSLLNQERWLEASRQIAGLLHQGQGPRATVFFGFSLAGYLAWLTDRALVGSPFRPTRLIALDTLPMHHKRPYRSRRLHKLIAAGRSAPADEFLHIRRAPLGPFRISYRKGAEPDWKPSDGPIITANVATYDHTDMIKPPVLGQIAGLINRFAENGASALPPRPEPDPIATPAGQITRMLRGREEIHAERISGILKRLAGHASKETFITLQYLALAYGHWEDARHLLEKFVSLHPYRHAPRYALIRMRRIGHCPAARGVVSFDCHPRVELQSFASVDRALAIRRAGSAAGQARDWRKYSDRLRALSMSLPPVCQMWSQQIRHLLKTRLASHIPIGRAGRASQPS